MATKPAIGTSAQRRSVRHAPGGGSGPTTFGASSPRSQRPSHLRSTIGHGTVFGEISLLECLPRSAACAARSDVVVLEFANAEVERLLAGRSDLALRFLGLLTGRLVANLRSTGRRLLRASGVRSRAEIEAVAH